MSRTKVALAILMPVAVVAATIVLLATGGPDPSDPRIELPGDVEVDDGPKPPTDTGLADVLFTDVRAEGDELVFEARLGAEVPKRLEEGALEIRWDIFERGTATWLVAATVGNRRTASVLSQDATFAAGTFDGSLTGGVERDGDRLVVRFDRRTVEDFPESFSWRLTTVLDGARGNPRSATARDRSPDEGRREFPEP
ncbi:MAG TPA: hypothetical protein VM573_07550 [Actinomycetota bacterium]|nr:hypothetical protein [Actinomycetota bacterium]